MLDVHVLSLPERYGAQLQRCLASVMAAVDRASFPVAVHVIDCEADTHIGKARTQGYSKGSYPYVTNVDDDDWVEPNAFEVLKEAMSTEIAAIYTAFWQHKEGNAVKLRNNPCNDRVLLRVYRRDVATSWSGHDWPACDRQGIQAHALSAGEAAYIDEPVYHYYPSPFSAASRARSQNLHILNERLERAQESIRG